MYRIISWHKWREIGILGLALLLLTAAAGTALGWKALGNATGDVTNHTANNYAGGAE